MLFAYDTQCDNTYTVYVFKDEIMPPETDLKCSKLVICVLMPCCLRIKQGQSLSSYIITTFMAHWTDASFIDIVLRSTKNYYLLLTRSQ